MHNTENHLLVTLMLFLRHGILVGHHLYGLPMQRLLQSVCQEEILRRLLQLAHNPRIYKESPTSPFLQPGVQCH